MRILTYHKSFRQRIRYYCFDKINELEARIRGDKEDLEFFKQLQKDQNICITCSGTGITRIYNIDGSTDSECRVCKGTGNELS